MYGLFTVSRDKKDAKHTESTLNFATKTSSVNLKPKKVASSTTMNLKGFLSNRVMKDNKKLAKEIKKLMKRNKELETVVFGERKL